MSDPGDFAFGDHESMGNAVDAGGFEPIFDEALTAERRAIGHLGALGCDEVAGLLRGLGVAFGFPDIDAHDHHAFFLKLLVELIEVWDGGHARAAPTRPAFEDIDFAFLESLDRFARDHRFGAGGWSDIADF